MNADATHVLSVSALTSAIRTVLEGTIGLVWVEGEVSNLRRQASGHVYFTLKDESAQLSCVMFRNAVNSGGGRQLTDGARVQLLGEVSVYEARGQYQLIVRLAQPRGLGALQAKFEELKRKLAAEGLFDRARKQPLPRFPRTIGVVTSPSGAALQDILNVLSRRAPWVRVLVQSVRVQGAGAAAEIAGAIAHFDAWAGGDDPALRVDVIVVTRGGGSLEDLWEFNEESVARAIAAARLPVVSAVGHEIDFTISDFAADLRAPTPSAAAELLVPDTAELLQRLASQREFLRRALAEWASRARERLTALARGELVRAPARRLAEERQRLDSLADGLLRLTRTGLDSRRSDFARLTAALRPQTLAAGVEAGRRGLATATERLRLGAAHGIAQERARLERAGGLLRVLGPQGTLERGYSITTDASGRVLTSVGDATAGTKVRTRLADGEFESVVG